jgi:hypothetical protein
VSSQAFRDGLTSLVAKNDSTESEQADPLHFIVPNLEHYEQFFNEVDISMMWGLFFLVIKASV